MNIRFEFSHGTPKSLCTMEAKELVVRLQAISHEFLVDLTDSDEGVLARLKEIILDPASYEKEDTDTLIKAAKNVLKNIDQTGALPHHRINVLADLLDTDLYPFMHLKVGTRNVLDELCHVVELTNAVVTKHTDTDAYELHRAWGMAPMNTRSHIGFEYQSPNNE